ncbi:MAG TPA: hypothetical protein VGC39_10780, partial [Candidatus Methylacidiphilales bacterium]
MVPASAATWTLAGQIPVAGNGGWDYLTFQPTPPLLYVTHQDHVAVLDLKSQKEIGSIPGDGIHGVALVPDLNRGFVTNGKSGTVTVFDLKTFQVIGTVPAQPDADAICYEPVSRRVLTLNGDSASSTVIDPAQDKAITNLPLGGKPEFARPDGKGAVYANLVDKDQVVKIDAVAIKVAARWPLPAGSKPTSMAIDQDGRRLFIGCR